MHNSIVTQPGIGKIPGFFYSIFTFCILLASLSANAGIADAWPAFRDSLFAGKAVEENAEFIEMTAPQAAENPALVPLTVKIARSDVKQAWLLVDGNPVPLTATFYFMQMQPEPTLEMRIRLEKSTWVRLVAETSAGTLHMAALAIKTPGGGCGGGMDGDETKLRSEAGQMKMQIDRPLIAGKPGHFTYLVKHPMRTGFERTTQGYYAKPWYIHRLDFSQDGIPILGADLGVGISADPRLRLSYLPTIPGTLNVVASDNEGKVFKQQFTIQ